MSDHLAPVRLRTWLAASGGTAGLAVWMLADLLPDVISNERLLLGLSTAAFGFFVPLVTALGPLRPMPALLCATLISTVATLLVGTASFRFDAVGPFLETVHPLAALFLIVTLPVPFLIAGFGRQAWMDYAVLFEVAWQGAVRFVAAGLFVAVFWLVVWLADTLFGLVGLGIIGELILIDWLPPVVSGVVFGLGMAIAEELSDYVSPRLPLQLMRLLLPLVLVITVVFLLAVPFRGVDGLFGGLSAAAILVAMSVLAVSLVSAAIDRDDRSAVDQQLMRAATRGLAVLMPLLSGLSVYAVAERVSQHGWSPDRLAAMTAAALMSGYGIAYAWSALGRRDWMARIRQSNTWMAMAAIVLSMAWLTPLLNPQRLSVADQLARYERGITAAEDLDLWTIGREWGKAGRDGIERLANLAEPEDEVVQQRLAVLSEADSRRAFEAAVPPATARRISSRLRDLMPVVPSSETVPDSLFLARPPALLARWEEGCLRTTPGGRPGCIALVADLLPMRPGREIVLFMLESDSYVRTYAFDVSGDAAGRFGPTWLSEDYATTTSPSLIDRIAEGAYTLSPAELNAVSIGEMQLLLLP